VNTLKIALQTKIQLFSGATGRLHIIADLFKTSLLHSDLDCTWPR